MYHSAQTGLNGFVALEEKKKNIYLPHPGDRALTQTDCLLLKAERGGRCTVKGRKKKSPDASIFIVSTDSR